MTYDHVYRPDWDEYFIRIANLIASRSTCLRKQYGAVIVDKDHNIVSTGYNGAPAGVISCFDEGECIRDMLGIDSGTNYEICKSLHSEMNAIIRSRMSVKGCDLYIGSLGDKDDRTPCNICKRIILNAGIEHCIWLTPNGAKVKAIVKDSFWHGL